MPVIATIHALSFIVVSYKRPQIRRSRLAKQLDSRATRVRRTDHVVVCSVTVLARLFGPGRHRQVDWRPGNIATSAHTVTIEAVAALTQ